MRRVLNVFKIMLVFAFNLFISGELLSQKADSASLANKNFEVKVYTNEGGVNVKIIDLKHKMVWADGIYTYQLTELADEQLKEYSGLKLSKVILQSDRIRISGLLNDYQS